VHVDGCRQALVNYVRKWLYFGSCVLTSVCFLLQAIILILLRYLQTSIALAIKKGDPTADSLAYIFSICLPTDDLTEDKCQRTVAPSVAPSAAPSFASSRPPPTLNPVPVPPSTSQTLEQAAAQLAAVGQPTGVVPLSRSLQSHMAPDVDEVAAAVCRRVPTLINNSARVDQLTNPPSVTSIPASRGQRTPNIS